MEALKSRESEFKQIISNRIAHCNEQLKNNEVIAEDDNFFFFKNGEHYSKPVMKALKEALVQNIGLLLYGNKSFANFGRIAEIRTCFI